MAKPVSIYCYGHIYRCRAMCDVYKRKRIAQSQKLLLLLASISPFSSNFGLAFCCDDDDIRSPWILVDGNEWDVRTRGRLIKARTLQRFHDFSGGPVRFVLLLMVNCLR